MSMFLKPIRNYILSLSMNAFYTTNGSSTRQHITVTGDEQPLIAEWGTTKTAMSAPSLSCPMITVKVTFPRPRSRLWHIHTLSYHHFNTMELSNVHKFRSKVVPITDARVYGCCHQSTISSDDHLLGAWHYAKADVKESLVYLKWSCRRASRGRRDNQTSYQQQNIL